MDALDVSRWQFGITTVYHFIFVPLTIGLAPLIAAMQTAWHITGNTAWYRLTRFFGKLFLINFALGVATGLGYLVLLSRNADSFDVAPEARDPRDKIAGYRFLLPLALVSVLADYVYIGGPSPAHGVDRVLASFNFLRLAFLLSQQAPELFALGLVPAALFVYAQRMKDLDRPEDWQLAHGLWHASGAAVACAATYSIS